MRHLYALLFFILGLTVLKAQEPSIEPAFFSPTDEITITYDVTGTGLASLSDAWIWMWLPDLNPVYDAPSNANPASSDPSATNPARMTKSVQDGRTTFSIILTPTLFYNRPASDITTLGMLLKGNDFSDGQTDDYLATVSDGFDVILTSPSGSFGFFDTAETITISAETSESANLVVSVDGVEIASTSGTSISTPHTIIDDGNVHVVEVTANNGTETQSVTYSYTLTPTPETEAVPAGAQDGINYLDGTSVTLVLTAPTKSNVFVLGDFNNWTIDQDYLMKVDGDQFWLTLSDLTSGEEYRFQYLMDGDIRISDPYTEKIGSQFDDPEIIADNRYPGLAPYPSETTEAVGYIQTNQTDFSWSPFIRPDVEDLIIYELLVRDFTEERTYDAVTERLDYLADLGVNAIELMPVMEFEGNLSWGYNPFAMFAVDKYYGTEEDLKILIDEAHKRGMAVILDIVLNHQFGRNSLVRQDNDGLYGAPTNDNVWFNRTARHPFNVGYDMNHESEYTKDYIDRVNTYWLEKYHVDGYRFDLSKGFTQVNSGGDVGFWSEYDASRIALLKRMADVIWASDPTAYVILEHLAVNSEEKELSDYGMMLWGNMNGSYRSLVKGSSVSLDGVYHVNRDWDDPHLVGYMESHDEERLAWDLFNNTSQSLNEGLTRLKMAAGFFFMVPGPKMLWQFGELGYDEELNNDRLGIKPTRYEYLDDPARKQLFDFYKSLINLRTKTDYVQTQYFDWNTSGFIKWITIDHPDVQFHVMANFDDQEQTGNYHFPESGTWYDYFTGASFAVTEPEGPVTLQPNEMYIYVSEPIENYIEGAPLVTGVTAQALSDGLAIYPNPSQDFVQVTSDQNEIIRMTVRQMDGKLLKQASWVQSGALDLRDLNAGLYMLEITAGGRMVRRRLLKE